jgi:hypothetical protein
MKVFLWCLGVMVIMAGCGQPQFARQTAEVGSTEFSLDEADALLSKTGEEFKEEIKVNIVVLEKEALKEQVLSLDDPDKKTIQTALKEAGLYEGKIDGKIGPKSKKAIREFQRRHDLVVDGKVGSKTWGALRKVLENKPKE